MKKVATFMNFIKTITALFLFAILTSCALTPKPPLAYTTGAIVNSLSANISMSLQTSERSISGNGFMIYRRPDKVHMILLSPFGTTLFEVFALGDRITLVYPSQGVAYSGKFNELPQKGGLQGWKLMRWVMDADPLAASKANSTFERLNNQGGMEKIIGNNGLIISKSNSAGEQVYYEDYSVINGVPLAAVIDIRNKQDDRIRLKFQDPEVNTPLDDAALTPRLDGLTLLPLSAIEGI